MLVTLLSLSFISAVGAASFTYDDRLELTDDHSALSGMSAEDCRPGLYSEELLPSVNICHLLSGRRYSGGNLSVDFYDVSTLSQQVFEYRELDRVVALMRNLYDVLDGSLALSAAGSDGTEVYMVDEEVVSVVTGNHYVELSGERKGVGFFLLKGTEAPYTITYQALFYDAPTSVLGVVSMDVDESELPSTFSSYLNTNSVQVNNAEKFAIGYIDYVDTVVKESVATMNMVQVIGDLIVSRSYMGLFPDVPSTHEFYDAILFIKNKEYVEGYPDGSFKPSQSINRAEFLKILMSSQVTANDLDQVERKGCFIDVPETEWYAPYVCLGKQRGIINGYADGSFGPSNTINQAEAIKILVNVYQLGDVDEADTTVWFAPYMELAKNNGVFVTIAESPDTTVTRAHMAEFLYQLLK